MASRLDPEASSLACSRLHLAGWFGLHQIQEIPVIECTEGGAKSPLALLTSTT